MDLVNGTQIAVVVGTPQRFDSWCADHLPEDFKKNRNGEYFSEARKILAFRVIDSYDLIGRWTNTQCVVCEISPKVNIKPPTLLERVFPFLHKRKIAATKEKAINDLREYIKVADSRFNSWCSKKLVELQ